MVGKGQRTVEARTSRRYVIRSDRILGGWVVFLDGTMWLRRRESHLDWRISKIKINGVRGADIAGANARKYAGLLEFNHRPVPIL